MWLPTSPHSSHYAEMLVFTPCSAEMSATVLAVQRCLSLQYKDVRHSSRYAEMSDFSPYSAEMSVVVLAMMEGVKDFVVKTKRGSVS